MREIEKPIQIIIDAIKSDGYFTGVVRKSYGTSARINIPPRYEGRKFILVLLPEDNKNVRDEKQ